MSGLPKKSYETHFTESLQFTKKTKITNPVINDFGITWDQAEKENCVFEFWFGEEFVGTCRGTSNDMCEWTWNTTNWTQHQHLYKSPAWERIDFIWGKATNNIAYFPSEPVTQSSRNILWLCVMLAKYVWKGGRVVVF